MIIANIFREENVQQLIIGTVSKSSEASEWAQALYADSTAIAQRSHFDQATIAQIGRPVARKTRNTNKLKSPSTQQLRLSGVHLRKLE